MAKDVELRSLTTADIAKLVGDYFNQKPQPEYTEGPVNLGGNTIWRVWTYDGNEHHAHYVRFSDEEGLVFYENFSPFAQWINPHFDLEKTTKIKQSWAPVFIASLIVIVLLSLVVYQVASAGQSGFDIYYVVSALIGGAVTFLFGRLQKQVK